MFNVDQHNVEPPDSIDGANVIKWAWSGEKPFGYVSNEDGTDTDAVYGLAICRYNDSDNVYRFSCDSNWETVQDAVYDTVENAIAQLPDQYKNVEANWKSK